MVITINYNAIEMLADLVGWLLVIFFAYRIYKKQMVKPKVWQIPLVVFVGLLCLSFHWDLFDVKDKLPILPLGVWILYFIFKGKKDRWQTYRSYAWLGFWANMIFFLLTLLTVPVNQVIYPKDKLSVYLSNMEQASIINIHPSAKDISLHKDSLMKQRDSMRQEAINSDQWYEETYMNAESTKRNERFPYLLVGASTKWGSGIQASIYIEEDGKGILVATPNRRLYYRSTAPFFEEGE